MLQRRFEDALKKLTNDLEAKLAQREEFDEMQRMRKEGLSMENDGDNESGNEDVDMDGDDGPLQGQPMQMQISMPVQMQMQID